MKPFIFQFKEEARQEPLNYSVLKYDKILNLSVNALTGQPAIDALAMQTETFTKTNGEQSDSDKNYNVTCFDRETMTMINNESSDTNKNLLAIQSLLDTTTATRAIESTDQDRH